MEYSRNLPLREGWDVIVCGAGPSGIAAAVAARRHGMKTLLIERYGAVGGCLTLGNVTTIMGSVAKGAIRDEIADMLKSPDSSTGIDNEAAKGKLISYLDREGVELKLQTPIVDAIMDGESILGVVAQTLSGPVCYKAARYIDATGDGYLAAMAGAQVMLGRDGDGLVQPSSLMYTIQGVNPECTLVCNHEEHYTTLPNGREYLEMCEEAARDGALPANITIVRLYKTGDPGERLVNATQANGIQPLRDGDIERAELELRKQIEMVNRFLIERVPGFKHIKTRVSASTLGVRESRRIKGQYVLCAEDLVAGRRFDDCVVHKANFSIDIHNPTGGGQAETDGCPHKAQPYDIPLRCLKPLGLSNLVLCGRNISGTHRAHASYRVMNIAMAIGQAAGTLAAVSVAENMSVPETKYAPVRDSLFKQGCMLFD